MCNYEDFKLMGLTVYVKDTYTMWKKFANFIPKLIFFNEI